MRVRIGDTVIPYPINRIVGHLRLVGLSYNDCFRLTQPLYNNARIFELSELLEYLNKEIFNISEEAAESFELINRYQGLRRSKRGVPPIIIVLEGASATGKSLLSISVISNLGLARIISTDSVRQILRSVISKDEHPELFCHTYQAHKYRMSGNPRLSESVRGFLAQVDLMRSALESAVQLLISEGADGMIEGVHIVPGSFSRLEKSVLEILIHPSAEMHKMMFISKSKAAALKSVSNDEQIRRVEFKATREIQDYMYEQATKNGVPIIQLEDYESAENELNALILRRVRELVSEF